MFMSGSSMRGHVDLRTLKKEKKKPEEDFTIRSLHLSFYPPTQCVHNCLFSSPSSSSSLLSFIMAPPRLTDGSFQPGTPASRAPAPSRCPRLSSLGRDKPVSSIFLVQEKVGFAAVPPTPA